LFILSSCENELYDNAIKNDARIKSVKNTTLKELLKNPNFSDVFSKVKSKTQQLKNTSARTALEDQYNFTILPEDVKVIETTDGRTSYTFQIERNTPTLEFFENLVIQLHESGDLDALIMKYTKTTLDIHDFEYIKEYTPLIQSGRIYLLSNGCIMTTWTTCSHLVFNDLDHPEWMMIHIAGPGCNNSNYFTYHSSITCPEFGGDGGTPVPNVGINSGDDGFGGSVITNPNTMSEGERKIKKFKMQLSSEQNQCFDSLPATVRAELENYVAYTLTTLEDGTVVPTNGEDPIHSEAEEMMAQMCANPEVFNSITPFLIEKKIDDSELDDCTKAILNKLKQNHTIAKLIARFDNPNANFNLKFIQVPNLVNSAGQPVYGQFSGTNQTYNYIIKLNSNYYNNFGATHLGKAGTMIHEMIHALIASVYQSGNNYNNSNDFPEIWNSYVNIEAGSTTPEDHEFMGENYVGIIEEALQEYQPGLNPEIYNDLAWQGIFVYGQGPQFNNILSDSKKLNIVFRKIAEMTNAIANGINPTNNPPCLD
jgi:hypothetical protein